MQKVYACFLSLFLLVSAYSLEAQPWPPIVLPGQVQPTAPGQHQSAPLPTLDWPGKPAEILKIEMASNGHITVAHALILAKDDTRSEQLLYLTRQAVDGALGQYPQLSEVDVSIYQASSYAGFGGPPPLLTASVPKVRLHQFIKDGLKFERLWLRSYTPLITVQMPKINQLERQLVFHGLEESLLRQRLHQERGWSEKNKLFFHGAQEQAEMALTFDDTPHPLFEPLLLDSLRRAQVKATFFCIGRNARTYPYFIKDMVDDGHEVANHTYHHLRLPKLTPTVICKELELTNKILEGLTHVPCRFFRPPGGDYSKEVLAITSSLGLTTVFWTDDPGDFDNPGENVIETRLLNNLRPGGIVLLHDNVAETIELLPRFTRVAAKEGYKLVTVGQLLDHR